MRLAGAWDLRYNGRHWGGDFDLGIDRLSPLLSAQYGPPRGRIRRQETREQPPIVR